MLGQSRRWASSETTPLKRIIHIEIPSQISKGRTIRYLGGGGGIRVVVACKLFFLPPRENNFCFVDQRLTISFYVSSKKFCCRMLSLLCTLPFGVFLVNIFFINFDNKLFFLPTFSTNFFFLTFMATNYFLQFFYSPPPQISNGASLTAQMVRAKKNLLHTRSGMMLSQRFKCWFNTKPALGHEP